MSDLIDRDALMKLARNKVDGTVDCNDIARFPTVDAEPVRHGYWIVKKTAICAKYTICSECKTDFKFKTDKGTFARLDMRGTNYCPNCGAKCDKEEQDG